MLNSMKTIKARIIVYGLALFVVLKIIDNLYGVDDLPFSLNASSFILTSINLIALFSLAIVSGLLIHVGISPLNNNANFIRIIAGLAGLSLCIFNILIPINELIELDKTKSLIDHIDGLEQTNVDQLDKIMNDTTIPIDRKSYTSVLLAKNIYYYLGQFENYMDGEGEVKQYTPSIDEIKERENKLKKAATLKTSLEMVKTVIYYKIILWLFICIFSIVSGVLLKPKFNQ